MPETTEVWNGTLRGKKEDPTSMTVHKKNDICNRREITPQGYVHYGLN